MPSLRWTVVRWVGGVVVMAGAMCGAGVAQDASSTQVETQLGTIYKPTQVEMVGHNVVQQGTVVRVAKGNFLFETPVSQPMLCTATVKEGKESVASTACRYVMKSSGAFLPEGSRLYVTKIKANVPKDTVTFELTDAAVDPATNGLGHPSMKTAVSFVFSNGYLSKADAGQLADTIAKLLPVDNASAAPAQQAAAAPEAPQQQAAPAAPAQVELGMSEDQVRGILGQPTTQRQPKAGAKVYVYSKQITFQNGKVTAIE